MSALGNEVTCDTIWVQAKGHSTGRKWKVKSVSNYLYIVNYPDGGDTILHLPIEDYKHCDPPVIDVTNKLRLVGNSVYCINPNDFDDHIATLCCNGKYRVSFNPFKVEKIT